MVTTISKSELKEVLMDPKNIGVREPYYYIKGENSHCVIVVSPGKNGVEFNKTYGDYSGNLEMLVHQTIYGQGVMVLQRNDENGEPKEIKVAGLKPGITVEVPAGFVYTIYNVGKNYLVLTCTTTTKKNIIQQRYLKLKKGLAYYVIDKKGDVGFEVNTNYKIHPQISLY